MGCPIRSPDFYWVSWMFLETFNRGRTIWHAAEVLIQSRIGLVRQNKTNEVTPPGIKPGAQIKRSSAWSLCHGDVPYTYCLFSFSKAPSVTSQANYVNEMPCRLCTFVVQLGSCGSLCKTKMTTGSVWHDKQATCGEGWGVARQVAGRDKMGQSADEEGRATRGGAERDEHRTGGWAP